MVEPLPDVPTAEIIRLMEHLHARGGSQDMFHICDETNRRICPCDRRGEGRPRCWVSSKRRARWSCWKRRGKDLSRRAWSGGGRCGASNCSRCGSFRTVYDVVQANPEKAIDRDFVLETIVTRMPYENYEQMFNTFVRWSRFGELFHYDETVQRITLIE